MNLQALLGRIKASSHLSSWILLPALAIWLVVSDGFVEGGRQFLSLCFLLALMVFFIRGILSLLFRLPIFDTLQFFLLAFASCYVLASALLHWPALAFLAIIGIGGGIIVGSIVGFTSAYARGR